MAHPAVHPALATEPEHVLRWIIVRTGSDAKRALDQLPVISPRQWPGSVSVSCVDV
jgi:hypothetical protein